MAEDRRIIAVVLPEGYTGASDFAKDCNVEVIGTCSESVFLREYSSEPDDPPKRTADIKHSGQAIIEDGSIVIRVALSALPMVVEGSWASGALDTRFKITNVEEFAADLAMELNREAEDGATMIHQLFDKGINEALEQGARGIEEHENQDA